MLGSDFSYEDYMHLRKPIRSSGTVSRLADDLIDTQPAYVIEAIPNPDESAYGKIVTYLDQQHCIPVRVEYFGKNGALHKEINVDRSAMRQVADIWIPLRTEMTDHRQDSQSLLIASNIVVNPSLSDYLFTPSQLRKGR